LLSQPLQQPNRLPLLAQLAKRKHVRAEPRLVVAEAIAEIVEAETAAEIVEEAAAEIAVIGDKRWQNYV